MRYAFLSDVHGRHQRLEAVLADALARGVERIISLGDVGGDDCLNPLRQAGALGVFGNYEVSGWRRLSDENRDWVRSWPPILKADRFLAAHAVPWFPDGLRSVVESEHWLRTNGHPWRTLFPYMTECKEHLWRAVGELESTGRSLVFHGHTHRQSVWHSDALGALRQIRSGTLQLFPSHYYVVGVGSVGLPEDSGWAAYALYDSDAGRIELVRISSGPA